MLATHRTATTPAGDQDPFERYRHVVAEIFARHHRETTTGAPDRCACGGAWPCREEELAAELLGWI
jgi:hypothetical protein